MANVTLSPNMSLPVPTVSVDSGPDWANNINSCLSILDQHNHASGSGVQITQAGISLNATTASFDSLSFNSSNAYALRSVRFMPQGAALALATDLGCLYESGVDLYYNDGSGNQIRMTQGGSIVGTAGSISGLPSGTASASYSGGTFVWQSATNTAANMDAGSYIFRNSTASSKGLTLSPPNAMAADYSLFLPSIPATQSIVSLDTSGNLSASYTVDNATLTIASNIIKVANGGITGTQVSTSANIVVSSLGLGGVGGAVLGGVTIAAQKMVESGYPVYLNVHTAGTIVDDYSNNTLAIANSAYTVRLPAVVSARPSTNGLMIVRGFVDAAGQSPGSGTSFGEGWTATLTTNTYTITFSTAFFDNPVIIATSANAPGPFFCGVVSSPSTSSFSIQIKDDSGTLRTAPFYFTAIGQRA